MSVLHLVLKCLLPSLVPVVTILPVLCTSPIANSVISTVVLSVVSVIVVAVSVISACPIGSCLCV